MGKKPKESIGTMLAFLIVTGLLLLCSCATVTTNETAQPASPPPDCIKNFTLDTSSSSGPIRRTWVRYDSLPLRTGMDAALATLQDYGYRVTSTDRKSGTILAEVVFEGQNQNAVPLQVNLQPQASSLVVHLQLRPTGGSTDMSILCGFYDVFERRVKEMSAPPPPKKRLPPSSPETVAAAVETPRSLEAKAGLSSFSPGMRFTKVTWSAVNVREGPGLNHKILGRAKKGETLKVLDEKGTWLHVQMEGGKEAWVAKCATDLAPKNPPSPPSSSLPSPSVPPQPASTKARSPM